MTLAVALDRLSDAASAAREIGLMDEAGKAASVLERARERSGFVGAAYVLALAGGTGVGKSSLLNALAGQTVSAVRAVRPTTDQPLAWVAESRRDELAPLLAWLGVRRVVAHADETLADVAILDLPDVDSVRTEHRATVDALLPRIDAVAWVLDPEKYDDARLHTYLRGMAPHAARLRFVLNKSDRLTDLQRAELADDLRRRLAESGIDDATRRRGVGVDTATGSICSVPGWRPRRTPRHWWRQSSRPMPPRRVIDSPERLASCPMPPTGRSSTLARAPRPPGRRSQGRSTWSIRPAWRARSSSRSLPGPVGPAARSSAGSSRLLAWLTGQSRRNADPAAYLRDWRRRGSLGRAVNPVHAALLDATTSVPSSSRGPLVATLGAAELEEEMGRALDAVAREAAADLHIGGSILWPLVGAVQLAIGAVFAFAIAWYVTLFVSQGQVPVSTVEAPILGPLPLPLVLLVASVLASAADRRAALAACRLDRTAHRPPRGGAGPDGGRLVGGGDRLRWAGACRAGSSQDRRNDVVPGATHA